MPLSSVDDWVMVTDSLPFLSASVMAATESMTAVGASSGGARTVTGSESESTPEVAVTAPVAAMSGAVRVTDAPALLDREPTVVLHEMGALIGWPN